MQSINIQISEFEYNQLGLNKNTVSFSELIEIIGKKYQNKRWEKAFN